MHTQPYPYEYLLDVGSTDLKIYQVTDGALLSMVMLPTTKE